MDTKTQAVQRGVRGGRPEVGWVGVVVVRGANDERVGLIRCWWMLREQDTLMGWNGYDEYGVGCLVRLRGVLYRVGDGVGPAV